MSAIYKNGNWYGKSESQTIQVDTLPTASADELGKVYQYIGADTADYKSNFFYKCTLDTGTGNYSWVNVEVQPEGTVSRTLTKAEYDALSPAEQMDGTVYYVSDWSSQPTTYAFINRINPSDIYDTNEHVIGSFLGKPLYQRTVDFGSPSGVATYNASSWNIERLVSAQGCIKRTSGELMPIPNTYNEISNNYIQGVSWFDYIPSTGNLQLFVWGFPVGDITECYVTYQYTKTTDSAGTAVYASENEYSTDETIVGKWIDGKPIYQRTWEISNATVNANTDTDVIVDDASNVEKVINVFGIYGSTDPFPFYASNLSIRGLKLRTSNKFVIRCTRTGSAFTSDFTVTFQYTKTS